jgi:hypothetical protein
MKQGDKVWSAGGVEGEVVVTFPDLGLVNVRWPWGVATVAAHEVSAAPPHAPPTEVTALREENAALRASVAKAKANVRDACALACGAISEEQQAAGHPAIAKGADKCIDAIAALDLEAL